MRSLSVLAFGLLATTASAQVSPNNILAGADAQVLGMDLSTAFAYDETDEESNAVATLDQPNGDFRAMAVGSAGGIWALHSTLNVLSVTRLNGANSSYDISGTATDWTDMVATPSGRIFVSTASGSVYEVDVFDGSLDTTSFNQTLATNTTLTNLATRGDILYLATANYPGNTFNAARFNVESGAALADQPLPYYRGHLFWIFDNGDILVGDNRDGPFVFRFTPSLVQTWWAQPGWGVDATVADDGSLWVLLASDEIHRLNPDTGDALDIGAYISGATQHDSMGVFDAASLLNVEYPDSVPDSCPDNPGKFDPGLCGCDFFDVPGDDINGDPGTGCVHMTAFYDYSGTIGDGAYVMEYATVGAFTELGPNTTIGARASVGEDAIIDYGTIVSRSAQIGDFVSIGQDSFIGRSVTIGEDSDLGSDVSVGYSSQIPDAASLGNGTILGNLVNLGTGAVSIGGRSGTGTVIGRGTTFANGVTIGSGGVFGPDSTFGDAFSAGDDVRVRKGASIGPTTRIDNGARIGRDAVFIGNHVIGEDANVGASVTLEFNNCVDIEQVVPRRTTIDDQVCASGN